MTLPLLATKLTAPPPPLALTERERLAARLEAGRLAGAKLALISAPAGSGKTTVARAWLDRTAARWAWLTLDDADNDPVRFLSYLLAAFGRLLPDLEPPQVGVLNPSAAPEGLLAGLLNALAAAEAPLVLVLDDYHRIRAETVHALTAFLLEKLPPGVQLALLTRQDPPLEVARLRAGRKLTELRAADLRFSVTEIDAFLRHTLQLELDTALLAQLEARTEGWAAAVQLAGLSLQGTDDPAAFLRAFSGSHRYVIDYLLEEVMSRLPDDLRAFLTDTCLLGELCAPLADAVRAADDSAALLSRLERANLFLTPLDDQRQWYRYHPLFAEALRLDLTAKAARLGHRRAADWLAAHGRADDAIQHALAAADYARAAELVAQHAGAAMQAGRFDTVRRWLAGLPVSEREHRVENYSLEAWLSHLSGDPAAAEYALQRGLALPDTGSGGGRGRLLALQAWLANLRELPETEALTKAALDQLKRQGEPLFHTLMLATLAHAQNRRGEIDGPTRLLTEAYELASTQGQSLTTTLVLSYLLSHLNRIGRRREGIALGEAALASYQDGRGQPLGILGPVLLTLSLLYYEGGELEAAARALTQGRAASRRGGLDHLLNADGIWTGIRLALTRGDWTAARALIAAARGPGVAAGFLRLTTLLDALAALADLGAGDVAAAARWADACGLEADLVTAGTLPHFRDVELLALADVRLTQGMAERAIPLLEAHIVQLRAGGRVPLLIAALIRLALAQEAEAHPAAADAALSEALTLAAPEGFVQVFRDAPVGLGPLLRRTRAVPAFSAGLLADFGLEADTATDDAPIEALSPTEARILALLAAGQSNAEIAAELVVSVGTAKWHVHNILRKLGVTSRLEAVAAAHELGLV